MAGSSLSYTVVIEGTHLHLASVHYVSNLGITGAEHFVSENVAAVLLFDL